METKEFNSFNEAIEYAQTNIDATVWQLYDAKFDFAYHQYKVGVIAYSYKDTLTFVDDAFMTVESPDAMIYWKQIEVSV